MGYYIDLREISLDAFRRKLETTDLLPSQKILKEKMDEGFKVLKAQGIKNMYELQQALKTKAKVNQFAQATLLPIDYLIVLRREVNSYYPQARKIKDFPCLEERIKKGLENIGIQTTVELYDKIAKKEERNKLKKQLNMAEEEVLLLAKLTDVSRIRYVNQAFATLLVHSDYDTVEKIKKADDQELYDKLIQFNKEKRYFKGNIGLKDMKFFIEDTVNVALDIEY